MNLETQVKARIESVQVEMNRIRAGLLVLGLSSGMRYLTGFTDEPGERMLLLLVPREGDALFFVPQLYEPQVRDASPVERFTVWRDGEDPALVLRHALTKVGDLRGTILVEPTLWAECLLILQQALPDNSFASAAGILAPLRMRKSAEEVELLRRAGELADAAFIQVTQEPIVGLTELQLAAKLEVNMLSAGADSVAFNTLVASGAFGAMPHHRAGQRKIEWGDVVILDYGCKVDGYCSDISRTVICGEPTPAVVKAYDAVKRAHQAAFDSIRPGVSAQDIDRAARGVLKNLGYDNRFIHRTGHGIGLDIHEPPYIIEGNGISLEPGMAFSIEPGVYFPDQFGIRLEDVAVVTELGGVLMTTVTRDMQVVG